MSAPAWTSDHVTPVPRAAAPTTRTRVSLRLVVPAASALLLAVAMLAGAVWNERQTRNLLVAEARARLALEAELLARASASAMLEGFPELTLQPILRDLLRGRADLSSAMVLDREGRVLAHPDTRRIGHQERAATGVGEQVGGAWLREAGSEFVAVMPIRHASGSELGLAIVVMPRGPLERALAGARARQWLIAAILVLASATLTFTLMSRLLRPVTRLREGLERIGRGDLETRLAMRDPTELGLLADTLDDMVGRLAGARRSQLERERLAAELEAAGRIQTMLRPPGTVRRGGYVVAGHQRPAAEVGGDYFDVMPLPDGRLGLVVADVSGKGLAGCLVTFMLAALVRTVHEREPSPRRLLLEVDRHLRPVLERGAFVTVWYGVLDPLTGDLTFASAGHLPTFVRRADGRVERHASKCIPLGILQSGALERGLRDLRVRLEPGDVVLQLTDGFTEAVAEDGETQLGFDGIQAVLEARSESAERVIEQLCARVETWTHAAAPDDDQTVLVVRREPAAVAAEPAFDAASADACVERARTNGYGLHLRADFAELERLRPWLEAAPQIRGLLPSALSGVESALHEVCANVVEHGYGCDGRGMLDLWWVPDVPEASATARGAFVLVERGREFDLSRAVPADLSQLESRLKGRGLGIAMIRRLMPRVQYQPESTYGHVTRIEFDADHAILEMKGVDDARCA